MTTVQIFADGTIREVKFKNDEIKPGSMITTSVNDQRTRTQTTNKNVAMIIVLLFSLVMLVFLGVCFLLL